eukprot:75816-Chlamydomonas_euryale.AAC.7
MFKTSIGPKGDLVGYLRPETAQGIFVNFRYGGWRISLGGGRVSLGRREEQLGRWATTAMVTDRGLASNHTAHTRWPTEAWQATARLMHGSAGRMDARTCGRMVVRTHACLVARHTGALAHGRMTRAPHLHALCLRVDTRMHTARLVPCRAGPARMATPALGVWLRARARPMPVSVALTAGWPGAPQGPAVLQRREASFCRRSDW